MSSVNSTPTLIKEMPVYGCLSVAISPLVLAMVFYLNHVRRLVGIPYRWFDEFPQYFLQYLWLAALLTGLILGVVGMAKRERPQWLSASGVLLTLAIIAALTVFFGWLGE